MTGTQAALALSRLPGVGRRRLRTLLARLGDTRLHSRDDLAAFLAAHAGEVPPKGLHDGAIAHAWAQAGELADACRRRGWHVWRHGAPGYPSRLLRLEDPPALVFVEGAPQPEERVRVAVIGTREPSPWGTGAASACAGAVVEAGGLLVAGLAWGVDTAAHAETVRRGGCTWAVLPSGLDLVYPPSNARLAEQIVAAGGALLSEYLPGTRPHPTFFVARDRLQAALSDAVVVIESGPSGGTLHTVRFARALAVPVLVTWPPGLDAGPGAERHTLPEPQQGPWTLLREGAARVEPEEVAALVRGIASGRAARATPRGGGHAPGEARRPPPRAPVDSQGRLF